MSNTRYVIIETADHSNILGASIRETVEEAINLAVEIAGSQNDVDVNGYPTQPDATKVNLVEVRKAMEEKLYWTDGNGYSISIFDESNH